jgi:hypothetical protein
MATVGARLDRVVPKLGVTSRAALRDALGTGWPESHLTGPPMASGSQNP